MAKPIVILAVFALSVAGSRAETGVNIGTVDMNRVFKEYSKTKEAEAKMMEARNAAKKEFDERAEGYKKELDEINKLNSQLEAPALSAEAKALKTKERDEKIAKIKGTEREINEFRQTREQQLQQQMLRLREGLIEDMTAVMMEQVKAKGLDLVFDKSGASSNGFSPILFSRERGDFTAEVIGVLNKKRNALENSAAKSSPSPAVK